MATGMLTKSRVIDTNKPITSRSGLDKAVKARNTLYTAMAILRTSGSSYAADMVTRDIIKLNNEIKAYYQRNNANRSIA